MPEPPVFLPRPTTSTGLSTSMGPGRAGSAASRLAQLRHQQPESTQILQTVLQYTYKFQYPPRLGHPHALLKAENEMCRSRPAPEPLILTICYRLTSFSGWLVVGTCVIYPVSGFPPSAPTVLLKQRRATESKVTTESISPGRKLSKPVQLCPLSFFCHQPANKTWCSKRQTRAWIPADLPRTRDTAGNGQALKVVSATQASLSLGQYTALVLRMMLHKDTLSGAGSDGLKCTWITSTLGPFISKSAGRAKLNASGTAGQPRACR